ncbi:hypothetical protein [Novacetimonas pomaceti]|uniref:hypothetical protein n=1 Tax=Novacetimonas pomaceti TaxID=2021998 RepID=UPI000D7CDD6F|nr:hypothetical protein [Novacetimonas pomaceti]
MLHLLHLLLTHLFGLLAQLHLLLLLLLLQLLHLLLTLHFDLLLALLQLEPGVGLTTHLVRLLA